MKKFFNEFKEFAVKGNMIEIAIGVIIGTAFNKVVDVIVRDIFMPPLTLITKGSSMYNRKVVLVESQTVDGVTKVEEVAIGYGKLVGESVDFLIITIVIFVVVKFMNKLKVRSQDVSDQTVSTPKDIELLDRLTHLMEEQNRILKGNK